MLLGLTMIYTCTCGATGKGVLVASFRINKGHLRMLDKGLGVTPPKCQCGNDWSGRQTVRVDLDGDDLDKVNAVRAKKGWPPWDGRDLTVHTQPSKKETQAA